MNAEFINGLVVDDHHDARAWLIQALYEAFPSIRVAEAHDLLSARSAVEFQRPDIALIDLGLPDGSGTDLIRELHQRNADSYKIVSTVFGDDTHLFDALRAGAQGYVLKDEAHVNLAEMLRGIVAGEPPLSPSIARRLMQHFHEPALDDDIKLTERERDVLTLLAKGFTVKKAAEFLSITPNTASGYVKTIYRKLNVSSRAEATLEASRRGWVSAGQH
ncbi:MAG: response regulator transcription factor [Pseudomonadota bacterium]